MRAWTRDPDLGPSGSNSCETVVGHKEHNELVNQRAVPVSWRRLVKRFKSMRTAIPLILATIALSNWGHIFLSGPISIAAPR